MKATISHISISGFKSIRELRDFELRDLNIIIGANGAGKSNFIQVFHLLMNMTRQNFQKFVQENGGADNFLHNGPKHTSEIRIKLTLGPNWPFYQFYRGKLTPTVNETFLLEETISSDRYPSFSPPSRESSLRDWQASENDEIPINGWSPSRNEGGDILIPSWMVYHFHDTSLTAKMRRSEIIEDNERLRGNGDNIAPFLLRLKEDEALRSHYREIVQAIRLVMPFFDDFRLDVKRFGEAEKVRLSWQQKGSDFPMQPYHLSDGSIRFICLATVLLQPNPPSLIVIDEPELGLHPEAIAILAELIQAAAKKTQLVVATQSPLLLNAFALEDIVVMNREDGQSRFARLNADDFGEWLREYSLGELWAKNVIDGGSRHE